MDDLRLLLVSLLCFVGGFGFGMALRDQARRRRAVRDDREKAMSELRDKLTFVVVGSGTGHPLPGAAEKLAAFYAKYPESRRTLRPGEKGTAELVREARDERAEQVAPRLHDRRD